jgi:hypothetical protein
MDCVFYKHFNIQDILDILDILDTLDILDHIIDRMFFLTDF